jgi:protein-disulfide isomerase
MKNEWFLNLAMGVLVACALLVTGLVVRREFFGATPEPRAARTSVVADWRDYAGSGHRIGPADAPVTLVMFSDFQCPACAVAADRLRALRRAFPNEVAVIYRHFPLRNHPHAVAAARASECAATAGRFESFHDELFVRQDSIGTTDWVRFAALAGVADTAGFRRCASSTDALAALDRDTTAGHRLQVRATPTLLINDVRVQGAVPLDTLTAYVERALRARRAEAGGSTPRASR